MTRKAWWVMAAAALVLAGASGAYWFLFSAGLWFLCGLMVGRSAHAPPPNPLAALDSMPLSWADPEHPAYEPNPDVRDLIAQGVPVLQAREEVRAGGGDPDKKPHLVGPKAVSVPIVPAVPAPGTTRTVRFDFRDETLSNSGSRRLARGYSRAGRGTYRIEVTDRHGKSHWGPPYVTREDALAAMPQAVAAINEERAVRCASVLSHVQIVRLDADGKWTPC